MRALPIVFLAFACPWPAAVHTLKAQTPDRPCRPDARARAMCGFVPNAGQWPSEIRFMGAAGGMISRYLSDGWVITGLARRTVDAGLQAQSQSGSHQGPDATGEAEAVNLRFRFPEPTALEGLEPRNELYHFFVGADQGAWRSNLRAANRLRFAGVVPGIDVLVRENGEMLEYDLDVAPGADPAEVVFRCEGASSIRVLPSGRIEYETGLGTLHQSRPVAWQTRTDGRRDPIECRVEPVGTNGFRFVLAGRDPGAGAVIDPGMVWSTYLGRAGFDTVHGVADASPNQVVVCGTTSSGNFPVLAGYLGVFQGLQDSFVSRLSSNGAALVWSTFYGGTNSDVALDVSTDAASVTIGGVTASSVLPGASGTIGGIPDGFFARLSSTGNALISAGYVGGGSGDFVARVVGVPGSLDVLVAGYSQSTNFPTTPGAYQTTNRGSWDAFVTRIDYNGVRVASTLLGGPGQEGYYSSSWSSSPQYLRVLGLAVDASGQPVVAGLAASGFPTTAGVYQPTYAGGIGDAFVTKLSSGLGTLMFSTFVGAPSEDAAMAVAIGPTGEIAAGGYTYSSTFPTTLGAFNRTFFGSNDAFVARLSANGSQLLYGALLGGTQYEGMSAIAVQSNGDITAAGYAGSGYPTTPGAQTRTYTGSTSSGHQHGTLTRIIPSGQGMLDLAYSTYLGAGAGWVIVQGLVLDSSGLAILGGISWNNVYPTTAGAYQPVYGGGTADGFVTSFDLLPGNVFRYGAATPACRGPISMSVTQMPVAGSTTFALLCHEAPPQGLGALALGVPKTPATTVFGIDVYLDLAWPLLTLAATADANGATRVPLPIPASAPLVGLIGAQFVWVNTLACGGASFLSTSDAIRF